jgi:hypothetical protein
MAVVQPIFGAAIVGPWTAWPNAGGPDAVYSVALLARSGECRSAPTRSRSPRRPTASAAVRQLRIQGEGQTPQARLWTLTAYDATGRLMANAARRADFHSRGSCAAPTSSLGIRSPARAGDWLPIARSRPSNWCWLYDTPLTTATEFVDIDMPRTTSAADEADAPLAFGGLLLGGIIHIAVVFMVPYYANRDAWAQMDTFGADDEFHVLPLPEAGAEPLTSLDPRMLHAVCRFSLSNGPVRITARCRTNLVDCTDRRAARLRSTTPAERTRLIWRS